MPVDSFEKAGNKTGEKAPLTLARLAIQAGARTPRVVIELRERWQYRLQEVIVEKVFGNAGRKPGQVLISRVWPHTVVQPSAGSIKHARWSDGQDALE
ncbi:hypothetical protein [Luteibacter sp. ME-Dv--P-043b]|uniref:hypothetical protein n=1 Tax=Luteibacter sp. ME-Dv--P-043b TaxID=3040291 RepID=UPI002554DF15|nr:hypothetical protein [Luteibacter sp. ME-Dv--P-043b]